MKIRNTKYEMARQARHYSHPERNRGIRNKYQLLNSKLVIGILFIILVSSFVISSNPAHAQTKAEASEKYLTKGEAVMLISATDFMKKKIGELLSWTIGYDISRVSRVKLIPTIQYIKAVPKRVPPDGRTIIEILASVDDPGGLGNIAGVRADLSTIGRLQNTMLVDNGLYGDQKADDGIYTLQTTVPSRIKRGVKEISVAVSNKKGWLALAKTTLDIARNPVIIEAKFTPDRVRAGSKTFVTITARVNNPGRIEDLEKVTADLRTLGYTELALLRNDGQGGDSVPGDEIFSLQFEVPATIKEGEYAIRIGASNLVGGYGFADASLKIYK